MIFCGTRCNFDTCRCIELWFFLNENKGDTVDCLNGRGRHAEHRASSLEMDLGLTIESFAQGYGWIHNEGAGMDTSGFLVNGAGDPDELTADDRVGKIGEGGSYLHPWSEGGGIPGRD